MASSMDARIKMVAFKIDLRAWYSLVDGVAQSLVWCYCINWDLCISLV